MISMKIEFYPPSSDILNLSLKNFFSWVFENFHEQNNGYQLQYEMEKSERMENCKFHFELN